MEKVPNPEREPAQEHATTTDMSTAHTIDSGLACLVMMAKFHGVAADPHQLHHQFAGRRSALRAGDVLLAAKALQLRAKSVMVSAKRLATTPLPAMAVSKVQAEASGKSGADDDGGFFILARVEGDQALIQCPKTGRPQAISVTDLLKRWGGQLILFQSKASLAGEMAKFDFSWFIPSIVKYRKLLGEVLVVSLVLQLFALVTPLFFQVVMDKVLVHQGWSTLDVIALGLGVVMVFEVVLSNLRSYVFAHTTSRMDVELGARLFRHLLALPLSYFHARRVGDSVARVRELENIRNFLTGNALTLVLDLLFSAVFLTVMWHYSRDLTLIVLASLPCYVVLSAAFTPVLRARLHEKFNRGAENQAFLVETLSGVDTVKSMAVEPEWTRKWDQQLAAYVSASFRTTAVSTLANSGVSLVSKGVTLGTMYVGAKLVIDNELTVGQLIAFNMLAGQVAQPVMRLAQMWTEFQQVGISVQRLGDILNTRTEVSTQKPPLPPLQGRITLQDVSFRYRPDGDEVLRNVSLDIAAGEVLGIVGRSGSGKSTLTRLVQRLYVPERGRVLVDGMDLAMADATSLRRQVGVVLQDNMLFNRSIRDNIALSDPGAALDQVVAVARLAGAHDFILDLPEGYDTLVGEHGCTLSGGQKQRLAIARALMGNPRILIFDEATSALDYESERVIQDNMRDICRGRTVLIIAHRLSAVRDANRIVVMDKGQIVECGSHEELLRSGGDSDQSASPGLYAHLHGLQLS